MKRLLFSLAALALAAMTFSTARAITYSQLIRVSTCRASLNVSTFYGGGWMSGYYPRYGYPYYWPWPSVYGFTYYEPPITSSNPELGIDFTNVSDRVMREVEFGLVGNGNLLAEVKDVGKFSPGAEIKHRFGLSNSIFPLPTSVTECVPLRITFMDGTQWESPHLPRLKHPFGKPD